MTPEEKAEAKRWRDRRYYWKNADHIRAQRRAAYAAKKKAEAQIKLDMAVAQRAQQRLFELEDID